MSLSCMLISKNIKSIQQVLIVCTDRCVEELCEISASLLTAGPPLQSIMEHGLTRVVRTAVCNQQVETHKISPSLNKVNYI